MNNNQCSLTCIDLCENNYNSPATDIKSNKKLKVYQQTVLLGYTMLLFIGLIFSRLFLKSVCKAAKRNQH